MTSLTVRLSGSAKGTETITGTEINGLFLHHPITDRPAFAKCWTVSHVQSGMNLGAYFEKRKDTVAFAKAVSETYNCHVDASQLIEQLKARGNKPSVADLAERFNMIR